MDQFLILLCDVDTGHWSIHEQTEHKRKANKTFKELRADGTPCLLINPSDFIDGYPG